MDDKRLSVKWTRGQIIEGSAVRRDCMLQIGRQGVDVGEHEDLEKVGESVEALLNESFGAYIEQATTLSLLHHDLKYVDPILGQAFGQDPEENVKQGICPQCPYPEAFLGSDASEKREAVDDAD